MAMTGDLFDVCVVGAGVEGSSAARYLASWGKNTLLLEQVKSLKLIIVAPNPGHRTFQYDSMDHL